MLIASGQERPGTGRMVSTNAVSFWWLKMTCAQTSWLKAARLKSQRRTAGTVDGPLRKVGGLFR